MLLQKVNNAILSPTPFLEYIKNCTILSYTSQIIISIFSSHCSLQNYKKVQKFKKYKIQFFNKTKTTYW